VELAETSGGEAHVDAGEVLRWRKFSLGDLVGPAAILQPLVVESERVRDRANVSAIGSRRQVGAGIFVDKGNVLWTGIESSAWDCRGLLGRELSSSEGRGDGGGAGFHEGTP
jgi:hypothetical protein